MPTPPATGTPDAKQAQREADLSKLPNAGALPLQLAAELGARPADTVTLEQVIAATKDVVAFGAPQQVLARKQYALYCASAVADGLQVTVCEYPDAEQAARGEAETNVVQGQLAGHQSARAKKSVLHLVPRSDTPKAHVDAVLQAFTTP